MPAFEGAEKAVSGSTSSSSAAGSSISFPVTRDHILHCSYDYWFPKYRTSCIRSRIIKLPPEFIDYIREDGIILSSDSSGSPGDEDGDDDDDWEPTSTAYSRPVPEEEDSGSDSDSDDAGSSSHSRLPPNQRFPDLHQTIKDTIKELGGQVAPKLNWSSPKDAAWISPHQNTIKCTTPDDIYLLLKSSSFITHDLDHAFDGTVATASASSSSGLPSAASTAGLGFQPVLVLRSFFNPQTAQEFRCFVKQRSLIAITQRDLNHYDFLQRYRSVITDRVKDLFDTKLRFTFPDGNFCFDVYIPEVTRDPFQSDSSNDDSDQEEDPDKTLGRARLIDINPWAPRTDTLLFDWGELLELQVPKPMIGTNGSMEKGMIRLHLAGGGGLGPGEDETTTEEEEEEEDEDYEPELRLVEKDDPAAYNFSSPQYSAHKLPKEVVDASASGSGGLREFAQQWNEMVNRRR
ncbi:D123-domain-containing protein [Cryphonectria parasitica EP155]|uniref:D123-domain-containing protein n=1 Tax=Cryphonectria parasitica (strain ATCC 38755 / EP155) TaxID=660469 RepID=A0A9P5CUI6_CRYP1|nr:D123-domain-containing protein [Cryphonectria parasitica EP155]KAF3770436.1 D123-domain-containing protein [Cryphonectria parasitica EP155]